MGDLTKNLSRSEFRCRCGCGFDTVDFELVTVLQAAVDHFSREFAESVMVVITGPNRCKLHNTAVGGSSKSLHITGRAVDHKMYLADPMRQIPPGQVSDYYESLYPDKFGIGRYDNRTHIDVRSDGPARWDKN